jgi:hypothetical protein
MLFPIRLLVAVFACYRLSQYLPFDDGPWDIFEKIRILCARDYDQKGNPTNSLGKFVRCPFCIGVWMAIICVVLVLYPSVLGDLFLLWQGIAGAAAFLEGRNFDAD